MNQKFSEAIPPNFVFVKGNGGEEEVFFQKCNEILQQNVELTIFGKITAPSPVSGGGGEICSRFPKMF